MPDLDTRIAEIAGRAEAATEGPWTTEPEECDEWYGNYIGVRVDGEKFGESFPVFGDHRVAHAAFIAHAREDIPFLLAALQQTREALQRIAELKDHPTVPPPDYGDFAIYIARAALAPEQTKGAA